MKVCPGADGYHKACEDEQGVAALQVFAADDPKQQRRGESGRGGDQ